MLLSQTEDLLMFSDLQEESSSIEEKERHRRFVQVEEDEFSQMLSELHWDLKERQGEVTMEIGYNEDSRAVGLEESEFVESMQCMERLGRESGCEVSFHFVREVEGKKSAVALLRKVSEEVCLDVRVAVCGNVDAGKSTLIGVLTSSQLDNGRGESRTNCFRYPHEFATGRTSSVGYQIVGFNSRGECVNDEEHRTIDWANITNKSSKIVSFVDLAGHEKYLKTTISGMTGHLPDYCLLIVGANMGITRMTKEHLVLACSLDIPTIVVITKIDIAPEDIRKRTIESTKRLIKSVRKTPIMAKTEDELLVSLKNVANNTVVPIFEISNVTGENLETFKTFINLLQPRIQWNRLKDNPTEVQIDNIHYIRGVGTVVTGIVISGTVNNRDKMLLGPFKDGSFQTVKIKSCQINHVSVSKVPTGRSGGFSINVGRSELRKGMYLIQCGSNPKATWEFEAKIVVFNTSTSTIKSGYSPVIQCMGIRQTARISSITEREMIRTGEKGTVAFKFMYRPEYIKVGMRIVLTDGKSKAFGVITKIN